MIATEQNVRRNGLIAALPTMDRVRWLPRLEPVDLSLGQVLHESGAKLRHAYFPTTAIVSLLYGTTTGASAQVALVGHDGVVGAALFMGGESTPSSAVVQHSGKA